MNQVSEIAFPAFLLSVEVLGDRGLRIRLQEKTGRGGEQIDPLGLGMLGREIIPQATDATYEIEWPVVACFAVRGDPFPKLENLRGTISESDDDSAFLDWVKNDSHAEPDYVAAMGGEYGPDPSRRLRHWIVACNEARIDVAAIEPPLLRRIDLETGKAPSTH